MSNFLFNTECLLFVDNQKNNGYLKMNKAESLERLLEAAGNISQEELARALDESPKQ